MQPPVTGAIYSKIDSTAMGCHSGVPPTVLPPNQLSFAVNITNRGGKPVTRPAIRKMLASYPDETTETRATEAIFQGASFHKSFGNNQDCLLASIGGRVFRYLINSSSYQVQEISIASDLNNSLLEQAWLFQGQDFTIINDGQANPLFFDGASLRRSLGAAGQELPASKQGHYCNGRIAITLPDGQSWIAGDLVYSTVSGTPAYNYRDSILRTTENTAILAGRAFAVPITAGQITSMFSVAIPDTSLGQGPLQIGTNEGVFSVNLPLDATLWTTTQQPTQTVSLPNGGPASFYGVTTVNGDAWYRALDGIRSFVVARRDFNTWVQTPLSFEMVRILEYDQPDLLNHASAVTFQNRRVETCSPYRVADRGIAHRGLIALDFNNISSLTMRSNPCYDGLWTGLPVLQILKGRFAGVERCFIFALDGDGNIALYELTPDNASWFDYDGESDVPIESWIVSGAQFGLESDSDAIKYPLKKLLVADLFLERLAGTVEFDVKYRSDAYPFWTDWHEFSICATACAPTCPQFFPPQEQYATYQRLPNPADGSNPMTGQLMRTGYYFQVRLQWTGHAGLDQALVWSVRMPETVSLASNRECKLLSGCIDSPFTYSIE